MSHAFVSAMPYTGPLRGGTYVVLTMGLTVGPGVSIRPMYRAPQGLTLAHVFSADPMCHFVNANETRGTIGNSGMTIMCAPMAMTHG